MLANQRHLFDLPESVTYLNGAYMSAQLKSVEEIGLESVRKKSRPYEIAANDFFVQKTILKQRFAQLIEVPDPQNIAIIPSVSYGIANAAKNIDFKSGDEIILVDEQFPSNVYSWKRIAREKRVRLKMVKPPQGFIERGKNWNKAIIDAINEKTAVVAMGHIHWADGTLFNLKEIREKTRQVGALLIIDGTQSVGALPFSVKEIEPDALICAGYKWLMGPYSLGVAYYSDTFNDGVPIEENWINRLQSEDFTNLTNYQEEFQPKAERFSAGESSNFILVPMLINAIEQLLEWKPNNIQEYCNHISKSAIGTLRAKGHFIESDEFRAKHLFGVYLAEGSDMETVKKRLMAQNIFVSYRGKAIRVAPHVYNTQEDFTKFLSCF